MFLLAKQVTICIPNIRYNNIQTCGNLSTCCGLCRPSSQTLSTNKIQYQLFMSQKCNSRIVCDYIVYFFVECRPIMGKNAETCRSITTCLYIFVFNIFIFQLRIFCYRESLLSLGAESFVFQFVIQNTRIYRNIILLVVLYGCETWSLTLREERRLGVFENRVLRSILGPKRDDVTGEWRRLHNGELYDLYSLPNNIRVIKTITKNGRGIQHEWGREEMHTGVWWEI